MIGKGDLIIDETVKGYIGCTIQPKKTFSEWDVTFSQLRHYKIAALCRSKDNPGLTITLIDEGESQGARDYMIFLKFDNPRALVNFLSEFTFISVDDTLKVKDNFEDSSRYMPWGLFAIGVTFSLLTLIWIALKVCGIL